MDHLMTRQLDLILKEGGASYDWKADFEVQPHYLDARGKGWLAHGLEELGGKGTFPLFEKIQQYRFQKYLISKSMNCM